MSQTAIIYARVSTRKQADEELPIASQLEVARKKAASLGAVVVREFTDEGISGRTDNRPEFRRAIAYCDAHKVSYFIIWDSARFSRDRIDSAAFKRAVRRAGTQLVYVSIDIDPSTDEGWMAESMIELVDELYSRRVSKDTRRSMMKNAQDGFYNGGRVPYGYKTVNDGRRKRLAVDELEAPLVCAIFASYVNEGRGCKEIAMSLNQRGFLKRGEPWGKKSVGLVLKNHRYIGVSIFNRRDHKERAWRPSSQWIVADSHEPIVERAMFERAQSMMSNKAPASNASSPRSRWAFTGLVFCGLCGKRMKIATGSGRRRTYSYYSCSTRLDGKPCDGTNARADLLDAWLIEEILSELIGPDEVKEIIAGIREKSGLWAEERRQARELLVRELRDVEARRDRLFKLVESSDPDEAQAAGVMDRLKELRQRAQQIEISLDALEATPDVNVDDAADVDIQTAMTAVAGAIRDCKEPERLRSFFGQFLEKAVIGPGRIVDISYYPERMITLNPSAVVQSEGRWLPDLGSNQGPAD